MDNVHQNTVIRQLCSLLPLNVYNRSVFDHYTKKLTTAKCIIIYMAAQLGNWTSYDDFQTQIRAQTELQDFLQLSEISGSQISRKIDQVPTELVQWLFYQTVAKVRNLTSGYDGISANIGKLSILDSTHLYVPRQSWACFSPNKRGVKMHLRLIAASPETVYPDEMIPSTCNVDDRVPAIELVTESDATYVMDRGYEDYRRMDKWVDDGIRFVVRMRDRASTTIVEEFPVPASSRIKRDAKIQLGSAFRSMENPIRLVEYEDEQGRSYRVVTSRWDLSAEEVAQIYKSRWLIELFFKWLKQHLRMVKVYSYKPQALWNQLFIALITYLLVLYTKLKAQTKMSCWKVLQKVHVYLYRSWTEFEGEMNRKPTRTSKGRQQPRVSSGKVTMHTTIGMIKPQTSKENHKK